MKTIYNIFKKVAITFIFLMISTFAAFSTNAVIINLSNRAEVTSVKSEADYPMTEPVSLILEWRNTPMTASAFAALFNQPFSSYGVTATVRSLTNSTVGVTLSPPTSFSDNLDIVIIDYASTKTIHWIREKDLVTEDSNYIETTTYTGTGSSDYYKDITYYNGLGLPEMHISGEASGNGNSIVTPVVYDECLRGETTQPLPFERTDGSLRKVSSASAVQAYEAIYGSDSDFAFTANRFDSYSLNRLTSSVMPGAEGRDRSRMSVIEYGLSDASDKVLNLIYNETASDLNVSTSPAYLTGLSKTVCRDENDKVVITFTDAMDRVVLIRRIDGQGETSGLDTYTVYDNSGRPVWIISPEGSKLLGPATTFSTSSTLATEWSTLYKYDCFGRMTERKIPGRGNEYFVYDKGGRLLLYQDGNLRTSGNRWMYRVYDVCGREIEKTVIAPVNSAMSVEQVREMSADLQFIYPDLNGISDYRVPSPAFVFDKQLSSARYGGQYYRTSPSNPTASAAFSVPSYLSFAVVPDIVLKSEAANHLKVYEKVWILGDASTVMATNAYVERAFYYDIFGRIVQTVERDPWGNIARVSVKYDRQGNILARKESRTLPISSKPSAVKVTSCTYDLRGRILSETTTLSGSAIGETPVTATVQYAYDELGRLKGIHTGDGVTTERDYTTQGWVKSIEASDQSDGALFNQRLEYQDCGAISSVSSAQGASVPLTFEVSYDRSGRMTAWQQDGSDALAEKDITYDANGNILSMKRYGSGASLETDYTYIYSGNALTSLSTGSGSTRSMTYDSNGNLVADSGKALSSATYNELNLPESAEVSGALVHYLYLSDGTKLAALRDGTGYIYCGSMVYEGTFTGSSSLAALESTGLSAGRIVKNGSAIVPTYHVNDYLCSVRVVTDAAGEVLERNDYSGFGKRLESSTGSTNRYRFSGKEEQEFAGLPWQDFGARMYDPDLARWTTQDPLADQYHGISPYAYCNNNPVNFVDPDGKFPVALPLLPIVFKTVAVAGGLTLTFWAADKLAQSYESAKYNPGYENQKEQDRRKKRALDQAQINVQNSINNNFPDPNQHDPNDGPNMKRGSNFKKAAFLSLALIGGNHEFLEELIKNFLLNDEGEEKGEEKKEIDTDANVEVFVSPTPKEEQDKLDEQTEGINYIYHFLWDQGPYPEYFGTY